MNEEAATKGKWDWYVVRVVSGMEKSVQKSLRERIASSPFAGQFGEIMVPSEEVVEMRAGQKRQTQRKIFPGYILVEMEFDNNTWHFVKSVPRVLGFIGETGAGLKGRRTRRPSPLSPAEAERVRQRMDDSRDKPRPKVFFEPGEVVRVISGPFKDFNGAVEEMQFEKNRLRIAVQIFGRSTPVDLEFNQVEKI